MKKMRNIFILSLFIALAVPAMAFDVSQCSKEENEDDCRARLDDIAEEIEIFEENIKQENKQQQTLSTVITGLTSDIKKTSSEISRKNSLIANIKNDIVDREKNLESLNIKLEREKESLSKIIRKRYELGDTTILEYLLSAEKVSAFYEDVPAFSYVQSSLSDSFDIINQLKQDIYGEKQELEEKRQEEDQERYNLKIEKNKIEDLKDVKNQALDLSQSKKASLEQLKKLREEEARKIRTELIKFQGSGITSRSISFGEAYDYAKQASKKTGVDPAFIMAIMQQETGFGNNVGGCYLKDGVTGDGVYIKSGKASKRNIVPGHFTDFKRITGSLGRDWQTTPISCAIVRSDGSHYGYGGAMGYTQFIPGTWAMVEARVESYLSVVNADPWNPEHAVMATAVFMMDRGASGTPSKNYNTYYNAACRYYGACSSYASSVMAKTANIQSLVEKL